MRRFLPLLFLLVGCQPPMQSVPDTPPPDKPPAYPDTAALRPNYKLGGRTAAAGTAFVVADATGKKYLLTAAHVMDDAKEWASVQGVGLNKMGGNEVATGTGRPAYIGKAFDEGDCSTDLTVWPLAAGDSVTPLKLAAADPKKNEWVWAVGQEPKSSGPQKAHRCKVTGTEGGGLSLTIHDRFEMKGFSGGPLLNANGEVVGNVLGGDGKRMIAGGVSGIRNRLAEAGVSVP